MTKWEIGQDLIAIADFIGEKEHDLRNSGHMGNQTLANQLKLIRMQVGDLFRHNNDHEFYILDSTDLKAP